MASYKFDSDFSLGYLKFDDTFTTGWKSLEITSSENINWKSKIGYKNLYFNISYAVHNTCWAFPLFVEYLFCLDENGLLSVTAGISFQVVLIQKILVLSVGKFLPWAQLLFAYEQRQYTTKFTNVYTCIKNGVRKQFRHSYIKCYRFVTSLKKYNQFFHIFTSANVKTFCLVCSSLQV